MKITINGARRTTTIFKDLAIGTIFSWDWYSSKNDPFFYIKLEDRKYFCFKTSRIGQLINGYSYDKLPVQVLNLKEVVLEKI